MARNKDFSRAKPTRETGRKIVIACEGEKTEYGYFEAIRKTMHLSTFQIKVIKPHGSDPLSVVKGVIEERSFRQREGAWTEKKDDWMKSDQAWAVFDGDEHIANNPNNWNDALQVARSGRVHLAISNPSFEFWYLLHFQDHWSNLNRSQAKTFLKKHVEAYQKPDVLFPDPLQKLTTIAIRRAERLDQIAQSNASPLHSNPSTSVHRLVSSLLALQEETHRG